MDKPHLAHRVIPIFIPEKACPHRCIYCNQYAIAGQLSIPTPAEAERIIDQHLATIPSEAEKRIAFFGGSFTGIPIQEQNEYLDIAQRYVDSGLVHGIQLSTRPDYISQEILDNLKAHGVTLIELGAQSLDDAILRFSGRGHNTEQVRVASELIREAGFELGLQMMIGLPGDTKEKSMHTATLIHQFGAQYTRIYPTLVVKDTFLAKLYQEGKYRVLPLEEAVDWCKDLYIYFTDNNIQVLRMGLHPSEGLLSGRDYLAGPFHVSFKELVLTAIWHDKIQSIVKSNNGNPVEIAVTPSEINYAVGYGSANRKAFPMVTFKIKK